MSKNIIDLIIDLENVNKQLEIIRDPASGYIDSKVNEVFGNKKYISDDDRKKLNALIDELI